MTKLHSWPFVSATSLLLVSICAEAMEGSFAGEVRRNGRHAVVKRRPRVLEQIGNGALAISKYFAPLQLERKARREF
jgi:hypothetical protein